jgi:alpha-galactosidase/6-phospho-beta-glucosidase family protein
LNATVPNEYKYLQNILCVEWVNYEDIKLPVPTIITIIGAGSAIFGENTLASILRSRKLKGSTLRLVDRNAQSLDIVHRLANRLNDAWGAGFAISAHTHHQEALED